MRESFNYCRKECGLGPNFLSTPFLPCYKRILTQGIITTLWEFCSDHNIQVTPHTPPVHRFAGDAYLMQKFIDMDLPTANLLDLTYRRIYLQIETISDAILLDGSVYHTSTWNGERPVLKPNWPHQPRPSETLWRTWQLHLSTILPCNLWGIFTGPRLNLQFFDHSDWQWFLSADYTRLFRQIRDTIITYVRHLPDGQRRQQHTLLYTPSDIVTDQLPDRVFPATIVRDEQYISVDSYTRAWHQDMVERDCTDLKSHILIYLNGNKALLKQELIDGNLLFVCDGSMKGPFGSAAYVFTSERFAHEHSIVGTTRTTGNGAPQDSYRSELFGILAGVIQLRELLQEWELQHELINLTVACDNLQSLHSSFDLHRHPRISIHHEHFDVISSIRRSLPSNVTFRYYVHVEGHQKGTNLDILAQLNHRMDAACKNARATIELRSPEPYWHALLPNWKWIVKLDNEILCKDFCQTITNHISAHRSKAYLPNDDTHEARLPEAQFQHVQWAALGAVLQKQPLGRQRFMIKHGAGVCSVNKWRLRWRDRADDACPRCRMPECSRHVYLCQDEQVKSMWENEFTQLEAFLEDINTAPDLTESIISNLKAMYYNTPALIQSNSSTQQALIGWQIFF